MASYTYDQLKDLTVAQLRDIAKDIQNDALEGYSTMHKDHLLPALCKVLGIHIHHAAEGSEKTRIKTAIRKLQTKRDEALKAKNEAAYTATLRPIHVLKHKLRNMAEAADAVAAKAKAEEKPAATAAAPAAAPAAPAAPAEPAK